MNAKRDVSEEEAARHRRALAALMQLEENRRCADCSARGPSWASVNLGVFVCLTCSGIHRSLGVHISQVRSCRLDTWLGRQVEFMHVMGNRRAARYWEARLPEAFVRPPGNSPNPELAAFIRAKYVDKRYAVTDAPPPTIDDWRGNPYAGDGGATPTSGPVTPASGCTPGGSATPVGDGTVTPVGAGTLTPGGSGSPAGAGSPRLGAAASSPLNSASGDRAAVVSSSAGGGRACADVAVGKSPLGASPRVSTEMGARVSGVMVGERSGAQQAAGGPGGGGTSQCNSRGPTGEDAVTRARQQAAAAVVAAATAAAAAAGAWDDDDEWHDFASAPVAYPPAAVTGGGGFAGGGQRKSTTGQEAERWVSGAGLGP